MNKIFDTSDLQAKIDGEFIIIRQNANVALANAEWFRLKVHKWDMVVISKTFLELQGYDVIKREPELKPCPICGNEVEIVNLGTGYYTEYYIRCSNCLIQTVYREFDKNKAIEAWNALPRKGE